MKKFKIYILTFCALTLGACSKDFLDVQPQTKLTESNFYKTPKDGFTALVGCYDGLQIMWRGGGFPVFAEVLSDDAFGGTGNADGFGWRMLDEFDKDKSPTDASMFENNWKDYYKAIFRCNTLLSKLNQIEWGTADSLKTQYEAETRYIRAFMYFDMVKWWGNIPLLTVPSNDNIPQSNPDDVYKVIAEDLKFAAENLHSVPYPAQDKATHGRVTKWAAESLLARVFLYYTGYYGKTDLVGVVTKADALAAVEDVISKSGHDLIPDFKSLWPAADTSHYAGEDNIETVFAVKYTYTSDYDGNTDGNQYMVMFGLRAQAVYPYGFGWGGATVNPKTWNMFSDKDTRKVASITSIVDEHLAFTNQKDQREYTGYYNKKYSPMCDKNGKDLSEKLGGVSFQIDQYEDYVAIRYADVLLMAAELGSPNAQAYFDKVRMRAYKADFVSLPVSQANIMNERHLEFVGEGIRYWDLLRQGVSVAANTIAETTVLLDGTVPTPKTISAAKIMATNGLQQIPNSQITLSGGKLVQNPGW